MANRRGVGSEEGARAIGERLTRLRKQQGMTQLEMAKRLGVVQSVYSAYESGYVRLHGELLIQLSQILKVTADEILGLKDSPPALAPLDRRLLRRLQTIEKLSRRQQQALVRTLDEFLARTLGGVASEYSARKKGSVP